MTVQRNKMVPLGFTTNQVPVGTHICQIFTTDEEGNDALLKFILSGIAIEERAACFSEKAKPNEICEFLSANGLSYSELQRCGTLSLSGSRDVYFKDNHFDPSQMLELLDQFYQESLRDGYPAARVIGEMLPEVQNIPGGDRLLEYESKVSLLLKKIPVTTVCQYDARLFDGATIMDIMKVHPYMVVRGIVVNNPFFIPPEEFLNKVTA